METKALGQYELIRSIGSGGMADVFLARRRGPGGVEKRLAIKCIRRARSSDPRFVDMFVAEARLSMMLAHKNIVSVFDFGRIADQFFLVMDYIPGADLGELLQGLPEHRLDPMLVAFIGIEACQALDYAHRATTPDGHSRSVIHRDVTPRNILLSREGEIKLVDFGIATTESEHRGKAGLRGTPSYMSPEQARGQVLDGRSDVFSLGLVLWEAAAGTRAYAGSSKQQVIDAAATGIVPSLPGSIPQALRDIVQRATQTEPHDRYDSARDMQVALDRFLVQQKTDRSAQALPSHQLADLLQSLRIGTMTVADNWHTRVPDGPAVTFLEDGEHTILGDATLAGMRSIAETVADDGPPVTATSEPNIPVRTENEVHAASTRTRRRRTLIGLVTTACAAMAIVWFASARQTSPTMESPTTAANSRPVTTTDASHLTPQHSEDAAVRPTITPPDARTTRRAQPRANRRVVRKPQPTDAGVRSKPSPDASLPRPRGTLLVTATPWARVTVARQHCPETPCRFNLPAGTHTVRLENPIKRAVKTITTTVRAGQTTTVRETMTSRR